MHTNTNRHKYIEIQIHTNKKYIQIINHSPERERDSAPGNKRRVKAKEQSLLHQSGTVKT